MDDVAGVGRSGRKEGEKRRWEREREREEQVQCIGRQGSVGEHGTSDGIQYNGH
jgi:hypothetical protein